MENRNIAFFFLLVLLALGSCAPSHHWDLAAGQHPEYYRMRHSTLNDTFYLFLPAGYSAEGPAWPLMIFLHGSGECGTDLAKVKVHGPPELVATQPGFPFVVISPQSLQDTPWSARQVNRLIGEAVRRLNIDQRRVYLTGLSMGGRGTWAVAAAYPDRFAAIAPVCGDGDTTTACRLKHIPVWAFHGAKDDVVPIAGEQAMVDAVNRCGGDARITIYPNGNHNAWDSAYSNPELYKWLLRQVKSGK